MKGMDALSQGGKKVLGALGKYKFVLLIILVGIILLALPSGSGVEKKSDGAVLDAANQEEDFSVGALEGKLEKALSKIDGAGQVSVVLTVKGGSRRILAQDESTATDEGSKQEEKTTVVVSAGTGNQEAVLLQQLYPQFQGALVVATGGGDPSIRLKLMEAVSALTGLGSDKISICKGK